MKIILQAHEPQARPNANADMRIVGTPVRQARVRFTPVVPDLRLFHAL